MTPEQHKTLLFIGSYITERGYSPNYDEIAAHLGIASKSGVHRLVSSLERDGKITRSPNRARSIEVVGGAQGASRDAAQLAGHLATALMDAHGFDDGDGTIIAATEKELRTTLLRALSK